MVCGFPPSVLCDVINAVTGVDGMRLPTFSVAAWFMVLCDVINAVTELMVIGLQCCGLVYGSNW
jgi:hypothetical protein